MKHKVFSSAIKGFILNPPTRGNADGSYVAYLTRGTDKAILKYDRRQQLIKAVIEVDGDCAYYRSKGGKRMFEVTAEEYDFGIF